MDNLSYSYCQVHNSWFTHICIDCYDEVFHFGEMAPYLEPNYDWDDIYDYISEL